MAASKDKFTFWQHVRQINKRDRVAMAKHVVGFLGGMVWRLFEKNIWVIGEYENQARDNGYWLYKYIWEHHPEINVYYPIKRDCTDYARVAPLGKTVEHGSIKHYMLYWAAKIYASSTRDWGVPNPHSCYYFLIHGLAPFKFVFLNHGVARGRSQLLLEDENEYALIFAASPAEKDVIVQVNGQPENKVESFGFCRYDNLDDSMLEPGTILFMPTWRKWIDYRLLRDPVLEDEMHKNYLESEYFMRCRDLINNERILALLEEKDLKLVFYLHSFAQDYMEHFQAPSDRVVIAKQDDFFIQDLLKQASYLITDYSSVIYDFGYMKKPCCYYQYDAERFAKEQYAESELFSYEQDGFGPVFSSADEVIGDIEAAARRGFTMEPEYEQRVDRFFPERGTDHCKKTFEAIYRIA